MEVHIPKTRHLAVSLCVLAAGAAAAPAAQAGGPPPLGPNESSPHNMGYCAPLLGGGGLGVRPQINHMLATQGELFGYRNPGELYSARASDSTDRQCLQRQH